MASFSFWARWLFIVGAIISVFGLLMALLSGTKLFGLFNGQIDPAFWQPNAIDTAARHFQQWIYGIWGATIAGWGICLTYIAYYPFKRKEPWSWNCLALGILVWFCFDTALSAFHGVFFNVLFNSILLILVGLPLVFTRKAFVRMPERQRT